MEHKTTHLIVRQHDEGTSARRLDDDGQKLWVHGAERRVPAALGYSDVVIALLPLECLAVHVPKF